MIIGIPDENEALRLYYDIVATEPRLDMMRIDHTLPELIKKSIRTSIPA